MKILKIFGIVVGIHVFALVLIFANPGCSSTTQSPPAATDTVAKADASPLTMPSLAPTSPAPGNASPGAPAPVMFNPDAPAVAASSTSSAGRYVPTRPNTPVVSALVAEPVADVTPATTYAVKSGDSLWTIAKKHHLAVAELAAANSLSVNAKIQPGQKLLIPGKPASAVAAATAKGAAGATPKATTATPAAAPRASGDGVKHVVKSGESLGTIARIYGVKAQDIAVANNIADPAKINAGTELVIPGWQTPASKSGKSNSKTGAGPASKSSDSKAETPATSTPPPVPVIPIFENPITPAPKP